MPAPEPSSTAITAAAFVDVVQKSKLLAPHESDRLRAVSASESLGAAELADVLVEQARLTRWQADQLLKGRYSLVLGRYTLIDQIGEGGMGVVFKAHHATTGRIVALKLLSKELLANPAAAARFQREVQAAALVNHPNIVTAYDSKRCGGIQFLVMEYVDGHDLNWWMKREGRLPIDWSCDCIRQAALGLEHAHERGLVHRDIKPSNLLVIDGEGHRPPVVKILDMGLARISADGTGEAGLTHLGQIMGTPDYIAPEQARDTKNADIRSDIFSLGCTLFRLLTGKIPWEGGSAVQKLVARTRHDAPRASSLRPDVPAALDAIVARMLARNPAERFATPIEVARALAPFAMAAAPAQRQPRAIEPVLVRPTGTGGPDDASSRIEAFLSRLARAEHDSAAIDPPMDASAAVTPPISVTSANLAESNPGAADEFAWLPMIDVSDGGATARMLALRSAETSIWTRLRRPLVIAIAAGVIVLALLTACAMWA